MKCVEQYIHKLKWINLKNEGCKRHLTLRFTQVRQLYLSSEKELLKPCVDDPDKYLTPSKMSE